MALRARVQPALAGSLSSTFWVKKASGMDEAPMPAAPPTAQPQADATSCVDGETSKGIRMAQAKAIVFGNALVSNYFKPMSAEQKAAYDARQSAKHAEKRLQREERKQQQLARATGPGRPVKRPMLLAPEDLDKKFRELQDSRQVAGQPVLQHLSVLQAVASGVVSRQGSSAVGGGTAGGVAHATGAGCSVGVA
jgi:hypothetical protein